MCVTFCHTFQYFEFRYFEISCQIDNRRILEWILNCHVMKCMRYIWCLLAQEVSSGPPLPCGCNLVIIFRNSQILGGVFKKGVLLLTPRYSKSGRIINLAKLHNIKNRSFITNHISKRILYENRKHWYRENNPEKIGLPPVTNLLQCE